MKKTILTFLLSIFMFTSIYAVTSIDLNSMNDNDFIEYIKTTSNYLNGVTITKDTLNTKQIDSLLQVEKHKEIEEQYRYIVNQLRFQQNNFYWHNRWNHRNNYYWNDPYYNRYTLFGFNYDYFYFGFNFNYYNSFWYNFIDYPFDFYYGYNVHPFGYNNYNHNNHNNRNNHNYYGRREITGTNVIDIHRPNRNEQNINKNEQNRPNINRQRPNQEVTRRNGENVTKRELPNGEQYRRYERTRNGGHRPNEYNNSQNRKVHGGREGNRQDGNTYSRPTRTENGQGNVNNTTRRDNNSNVNNTPTRRENTTTNSTTPRRENTSTNSTNQNSTNSTNSNSGTRRR